MGKYFTPFRLLLKKYGLTISEFSDRFEIPVRTVENWSSGSSGLPEYQLNLFEFALEKGYQKPAYFCAAENCGRKFNLNNSQKSCPFRGSYEVYPNTDEGRKQSIQDNIEYENTLIEWDDE